MNRNQSKRAHRRTDRVERETVSKPTTTSTSTTITTTTTTTTTTVTRRTLSKPAFLFAIALSNKHCIATIPAQYPVPRYPTVPKSAHANVACANPLAASSSVSYDPGTHRATMDAIVVYRSSSIVVVFSRVRIGSVKLDRCVAFPSACPARAPKRPSPGGRPFDFLKVHDPSRRHPHRPPPVSVGGCLK